MKRTVSTLLAICLVAGLAATYGRAQMTTQATTEKVQTAVTETAAAETAQAGLSDALSGFGQKLCSDTWVEVCADPTYAMRIQFPQDGSMRTEILFDCDGACDSYAFTYSAADRRETGNAVQYADGLDAQYLIDDLDSDEFVHYDAENIISDHRLLIRAGRWNQKTDLADRLRGTSWKSNWFSVNGIETVRIDDFDVYPINEKTAYLEYRSTVGHDAVRATVVQTQDGSTLNVYMLTTYTEEGFCPETALFPEQWTAVS